VERHLLNPNVHVILVHFPLGVFMLGMFLEVFSFLWRRSSVRQAARWMIFLGALCSIPAAMTGLDARADVTGKILTSKQQESLSKHILYASLGAGLAVVGVVAFLGASDGWRKRLYWPILVVLLGATGLMVYGSHLGGEGVYLYSLAVGPRRTAAEGLEYYVPVRETHTLVAGLAIAVAMGALAASLRVLSMVGAGRGDDEAEAEEELAALEAANPRPVRRAPDDITVARTINPGAEIAPPRLPSARFWLLTTVLGVIAFGFGVWLMLRESPPKEATFGGVSRQVWEMVSKPTTEKGEPAKFVENRRGAHIAMGVALILLPLVLAATVRWGARRRVIVSGLCAVMVLVVAAEIWLGILLISDRSMGPLYRFAPDTEGAIAEAR